MKISLSVVAMLAAAVSSEAWSATLNVPSSQYATIQSAINAAANGDTILVAPGTYPERIDLKGKAIVLRSSAGSFDTRIVGNSTGPVVSCITNETPGCIIDGFTIRGEAVVGVVITSSSPIFRNCEIKQNTNSTTNGGGVSFTGTGGTPRFESCEFNGNIASAREGGAIASSSTNGTLTCVACSFLTNESRFSGGGGAIRHSAGVLNLTNCVFSANVLTAYGAVDAKGGAIYSTATLSVVGCQFLGNRATVAGDGTRIIRGGAIASYGPMEVFNSTFTNNQAANITDGCCGLVESWGGAIYLGSASATLISDCQFQANASTVADANDTRSARAGSIAIQGGCDPVIRRCTISGSSASAASSGYSAAGALWYSGGSSGVVEDCTISGATCGSEGGAVFLDGGAAPAFVRTKIANASATQPTSNGGGVRAQDGANASFSGCRFTQCSSASGGAVYTRNSQVWFTDCVFDANTSASGSALKTEGTGVPNVPTIQDSFLCGNSGASANWISPAAGWNDVVPGSVSQSASCGSDCNQNGILDTAEIAAGLESDCDSNGQPDDCQPDCDGDGTINACEISAGAADCDANGVPDSCQIAQGAADVNNDGILDSCVPVNYAGLVTEIVPIVDRSLDPTIPSTAICYRLYAKFVGSGAVWSMYGNAEHPLSIVAPQGFYGSADVGFTSNAVPCNLSGLPYGAKYYSWLTIGRACASSNAINPVGLNFTNFLTQGITDNDCGVVLSPGQAQGFADASGRVLLAQLTSRTGQLPTGLVNLVGWTSTGANFQAFNQSWPAPVLVDCNGNGIHDAYDIRNGTVRDCDESGVPDVCEYAHPSEDCNNNGIPDLCDIHTGASIDQNRNNVPDECECAGDVDGDGTVNIDDIIAVILSWGATGSNPADLDGNGTVGLQDLVLVLNYYGQCQ